MIKRIMEFLLMAGFLGLALLQAYAIYLDIVNNSISHLTALALLGVVLSGFMGVGFFMILFKIGD